MKAVEVLDFDFGLHCCICVSMDIRRKYLRLSLLGELVYSLVHFVFEALRYFKARACFLFAVSMVIVSNTSFLC